MKSQHSSSIFSEETLYNYKQSVVCLSKLQHFRFWKPGIVKNIHRLAVFQRVGLCSRCPGQALNNVVNESFLNKSHK